MVTTTITDWVLGNDKDFVRPIPGVTPGQTLTKGWFTIKTAYSDLDSAALLQKIITAAPVGGQGQITNVGDSYGNAEVLFQVLAVDTAIGGPFTAGVAYYFDVKVLTSGGKLETTERGTITFLSPVTRASA